MGRDEIFFFGGGESLVVLKFILVAGELANFWPVGEGSRFHLAIEEKLPILAQFVPKFQILLSHDSP